MKESTEQKAQDYLLAHQGDSTVSLMVGFATSLVDRLEKYEAMLAEVERGSTLYFKSGESIEPGNDGRWRPRGLEYTSRMSANGGPYEYVHSGFKTALEAYEEAYRRNKNEK